MERIGLIAGSGNLPLIFAREAKKRGAKIIAFAIKDVTSPDFTKFVDRVHWIDTEKFRIQKFIFLLLAERIKNMVMVGKIDKSLIFKKLDTNQDVDQFIKGTKDASDYSILEEVTNRLAQIGIRVIDGLDYLSDLLPKTGILTKRHPSESERRDIEFGLPIAREIARLDIGQTITVKNRSIVTVEAMEGTDKAIERAKDLVSGDFTVIKIARPKQDMRWDVPLIGLDTIITMIENNARVLAIESGKMFLVEKEKTVKEADLNDVTIIVV